MTRQVVIPLGVTSVTVHVAINDDDIIEGNEDFVVAFTIIDNMEAGVVTTATGTNTSTTAVTIEDNDSGCHT